jgi:anti-sigma-K factor RskA
VDQDGRVIDHREYEDLIAAAALDALTPQEHAALRDHMRACAACRKAYGRLLSVADALPLTVEEREPSAALRQRLEAMVAQDARMRPWQDHAAATAPSEDFAPVPLRPVEPARSGRIARLQPWWAAAAAAILVIGLVAGALLGRTLLEDDTPSPEQIALQFPTDMALDDATLMYMPEEGMLHFSAPGMPAPPEGRVYQVWLIGDEQDPVPMGMVDHVTGEFGSTVDMSRYHTFAVTVEPGPLGNAAPSSDPVIVAELPAA